MGSKREVGQARRRWEATVAPAERALRAVRGFSTGLAYFPELQRSPAAQAAGRTLVHWRENHSTMYSVDADLQAEVVRTGMPFGKIPGDVFRRLPHVAPLFILANPVPLKDREDNSTLLYEMFYADVTQDRVIDNKTGRFLPEPQPLLRFVWFGSSVQNPEEFVFTTSSIHLKGDIDLYQSLDQLLTDIPPSAGEAAEVAKKLRGDNWEELNFALFPLAAMLTLYACSQEPDLESLRPPAALGRERRVKGSNYSLHNLGFRIGAAIRSARKPSYASRAGESGRTVTPHMRKAHWHRFWTGPRSDPQQRKLVLRWIPPVAVNVTKGEIDPTMHPIRQHKETQTP